jgi:hypothetical protein
LLDEISHRYDSRSLSLFSGGCLIAFLIFLLSTLLIINASWQMAVIIAVIALIPLVAGRSINLYKYIEIPTKRGPLLFSQANPNREKVLAFVIALVDASKQYLI